MDKDLNLASDQRIDIPNASRVVVAALNGNVLIDKSFEFRGLRILIQDDGKTVKLIINEVNMESIENYKAALAEAEEFMRGQSQQIEALSLELDEVNDAINTKNKALTEIGVRLNRTRQQVDALTAYISHLSITTANIWCEKYIQDRFKD